MKSRIFAAVMLLALEIAPLCAAEPAAIPPAVGLSESAAKERANLFAALAAAKNDADARTIEDRIWAFWRSFADAESQDLLEESREAQLRFDYDEAIIYLKALVQHSAQFAEGWNQLGYVYSSPESMTLRCRPSTTFWSWSPCTTLRLPAKASF